jgi:hypothetical protein
MKSVLLLTALACLYLAGSGFHPMVASVGIVVSVAWAVRLHYVERRRERSRTSMRRHCAHLETIAVIKGDEK